MGDFLAILENRRNLTGNEQLGLLIGQHTNINALGAIGSAAAIAPTLREGLQVMENYARLHISYIRLELFSSLRGLSAQFHFVETDHSVEAIAATLGYQDAANVRHTFRNAEGRSPGEFRRGLPIVVAN